MTPFRFAVLLAICVAWGLHFSVVKSTITGVPPIFYAAMRMTLVAVFLIPFLKWHRGQMKMIFAAGACFGALNYATFFSGLKYVPASIGAIVIEFYVPAAMIFSVIFLHERVGWRRIVGATLAIVGILIIISGGDTGLGPDDRLFLGGLLVMCGALSEAAGAILVKKIDAIAPLQMLAWFGAVGAVSCWIFTLLFEQNQFDFLSEAGRTNVFLAVLYSAVIASIFGHSSYYWLLQRVDVSQIAPAGLMTTVFAVAGGVFLLGETFTLRLAAGALVTMTGVAIIVVRSAQRATERETEPLPVAGPVGVRIEESNLATDNEPDASDEAEELKPENAT